MSAEPRPVPGHNSAGLALPRNPRIADDLLWGAAQIAQEIGLSLKKTYVLLEKGRLPARRNGAL
jgi:hypothetical protein